MVRLGTALIDCLTARGQLDPRIWLLDADLGDSYGLCGPSKRRLGDRVLQAGIAEQAMVSVAAGLASCGARPWIFSFAAFLCCRAYDQIRTCVSHTRLPVVLVGSHAGGCSGRNGKSHAIMNDIAIMSTMPSIAIWAPCDVAELPFIVERLLAEHAPAYIRLPRDKQLPLRDCTGPIKVWGTIRDFAIVSTGLGTRWALEARDIIGQRGLDLPVLHTALLRPLPVANVREHLKQCSQLLVLEDHYDVGGLSEILRRAMPDKRVDVLAWPSDWSGASGDAEQLRVRHRLSTRDIVERCEQKLGNTTRRSSLEVH